MSSDSDGDSDSVGRCAGLCRLSRHHAYYVLIQSVIPASVGTKKAASKRPDGLCNLLHDVICGSPHVTPQQERTVRQTCAERSLWRQNVSSSINRVSYLVLNRSTGCSRCVRLIWWLMFPLWNFFCILECLLCICHFSICICYNNLLELCDSWLTTKSLAKMTLWLNSEFSEIFLKWNYDAKPDSVFVIYIHHVSIALEAAELMWAWWAGSVIQEVSGPSLSVETLSHPPVAFGFRPCEQLKEPCSLKSFKAEVSELGRKKKLANAQRRLCVLVIGSAKKSFFWKRARHWMESEGRAEGVTWITASERKKSAKVCWGTSLWQRHGPFSGSAALRPQRGDFFIYLFNFMPCRP